MKSEGKVMKVFTGPGCGTAASPMATVYPTVGAKEAGLPRRALNALAGAVRRKPQVTTGPAVGPGASIIKL